MYMPARRTLRWSLASSALRPPALPVPSQHRAAPHAPGNVRKHRCAPAAQISFAMPAGALLSAKTYKAYQGMRVRALGRVEWKKLKEDE